MRSLYISIPDIPFNFSDVISFNATSEAEIPNGVYLNLVSSMVKLST